MTYIYDVTLNFNEVLYDFFEWNNSDTLLHIRKLPIFKLNIDDFVNILNNEIALSNEIFNKIKDKTEIYGKKNKFLTCCLFRSDEHLIALQFDDKGVSKKISSIIIEEELDILESKTAETKNFEYKIIKKRKQFITTRNERKNKNYLQKQLNSLNIYNDEDKIKYLYFEHFGKFTTNPKEALARLKQEINNEPFNDNLKYFFKLSSNHN